MTKIELELVTLKEIEPGSKTGFTDLFLMLFKEKDGERLLPVFIGGHEAALFCFKFTGRSSKCRSYTTPWRL